MTLKIPVKYYLGRFSYEPQPHQTHKKIGKKIHTVIADNGLNNLNIEELLVRGTIGSNVTLDEILRQGTDRFGKNDTYATEGDLMFSLGQSLVIYNRLNEYISSGRYKRILRRGEKRIARHRNQYPALLAYNPQGLTPINRNDHYEFLIPPNKALLAVFYFTMGKK